MKLLLISVAVFGLAECQNQVYEGPDILPSILNVLKPYWNGRRMEIVDSMIGKFQETLQNIVWGLDRVKRPLKQNGFSNLATLVDNMMYSVSRFSDRIGRIRRSASPPSFRSLCQPYDSRPECRMARHIPNYGRH